MIVRNFEYLLALHREGHFGNAAKSCNVSQPTLSAGIKQLEEDMGVEIVRHGRRYDGLTSKGCAYCLGLSRCMTTAKGWSENSPHYGEV
ncbi:LysR family transcriptional regulator [Burkholderia cenocepacia]|uniref:LysR family transcriptional regulator n=1 Tax=Burkholderia cenocepacia TaxID=95486 RepID=A0A6J5JYD9_9BURK|nr:MULTISPECIES: LysR family transcriptional regulator [Burkholderia cepacia complex]CAB3976137.1 LysR family transcriptional regulator [Burkholderia cenocepacia]